MCLGGSGTYHMKFIGFKRESLELRAASVKNSYVLIFFLSEFYWETKKNLVYTTSYNDGKHKGSHKIHMDKNLVAVALRM